MIYAPHHPRFQDCFQERFQDSSHKKSADENYQKVELNEDDAGKKIDNELWPTIPAN
jgi:hypothetical protein